jgi:uncharacterized membrane protein YfcA
MGMSGSSAVLSMMPLVAAVFLFAGFIKGFTGLGFITLATVPLVLLFDVQTAIALVFVSSVLSNLQVMIDAGAFLATSRRFWSMYVAALPGLVLGNAALLFVSSQVIAGMLGVLLISYASYGLCRPEMRLSQQTSKSLQMPVGLLHGLLAGLTGSQVMPLLPYLMSVGLKPREVLQASNTMFTLCCLILATVLWSRGVLGVDLAAASMLCLIPTVIGVMAGSLARRQFSAETFKPAVMLVLMGLGLALLHNAYVLRPGPLAMADYP